MTHRSAPHTPHTSHSLLALPAAVALLAVAFAAPGASAQPTGNPKGSAAPISQDMSKSPAGGSGAANASGGGDTGKIDSGPASARLAPSREAGTGTAGGLPKRNVGDGTASGPASANSSQTPTRQPTSPAR
ncbi:MAG: hypothetical protein JWQ73_121 [Variovorax sp.]|nr:hypothetical protein [Variovorax sp.]